MPNEITSTSKKLTKKQLAELSSFTDPSVILKTLADNDWTVEKSIETLVDIAKNANKEATRLAATRYLNQLILDAMERSGLMVVAKSRALDSEGREITFTGKVVSKSLQDQKEMPSTDTKPEEITPRLVRKTEDDSEKDPEESPEKDEEGEGHREKDSLDSETCKYPEGTHDATGQFGGIAVLSDIPDTIHIL